MPESQETSFEEHVHQLAEQAVFNLLKNGSWLDIDYKSRIKIEEGYLQDLYASVRKEKIKERLRERIEEHIADKLFNALATEMANDVKQILSNRELREEARSFIRGLIRQSVEAATIEQIVGPS